MEHYSHQMEQLIAELGKLPGIGVKSAQRLAFHLIAMDPEDVHHLAETMVSARDTIRYCKQCYTLTDQELCGVCSDPERDQNRADSLCQGGPDCDWGEPAQR